MKSIADWPLERCTKEALEQGYKAAKLGAGEQALAMSFKEPLLAAAKQIGDKREQNEKQEEERAKARANWK